VEYHDFITKLNIPKSCELNQNVYKSLFYDKGDIKYADKQIFIKDIEKITWLYTLKEDTIPISPYLDDELDYSEIAVIEVELRKNNRIERIAKIMQRTIPYPLIIIFKHNKEILLNLAHKRINKSDHEKATFDYLIQTDWFCLDHLKELDKVFIDNIDFNSFTYLNFYQFYFDIINRVIAYKVSKYTGEFKIYDDQNIEEIIEILYEIENNEAKISSWQRKIKKEKQFNKKMDLNMKIKKLKNKNINLIDSLKEE